MFKRLMTVGLGVSLVVLPASAMNLQDLIAKNLDARGGKDKIVAVNSVVIHGRMRMPNGIEAPFTWKWKRPDKLRTEFTLQGMTGIQAYDGKTAWMVMPFTGNTEPQKMPKEATQRLEEQADFDGPFINTEKKGYKLELVDEKPVSEEGTDAYKVKVTNKFGDVTYQYLDAEYFLTFKEEAKRTIRGQDIEIEISIGDYKKVDGLVFPFSTQSKMKGSEQGQSVTFDKVELGKDIDDAEFTMPEPKPTPVPGDQKQQ